MVPLGGYKWQWLVKNLVQFMSEGSIIIFVTKKQNCEELAHNLKVKAEINCRLNLTSLNFLAKSPRIHQSKHS